MARKPPGIIVAYDKSEFGDGDRLLLDSIAPHIDYVKVGLQAMTAEIGTSMVTIAGMVRGFTVSRLGKKVMWDMKLHDIGNTVDKAAANIVVFGSELFTLDASVSDAALASAAKATTNRQATALAVTVLTDLDDEQCETRFLPKGYRGIMTGYAARLVEQFAENAHNLGIRGFVCSALEARVIREKFGDDVVIVTPAIRPAWAAKPDEQRRITTPTQAAQAGADYIVVGRPIMNPPSGITPPEAARRIREELDAV